MVNFGINWASLLGMALIFAALIILFLRPRQAQAHDHFFTIAALLSGFILIYQGWRLDEILQFAQLMIAITAIFYTVESIHLRE